MTPRSLWLTFAPYVVVSIVHVVALFGQHPLAPPTKLLLMPLLAFGVLISLAQANREMSWHTTKKRVAWLTVATLIFGIFTSWLGDGSATFFPMFEDELPMMLLNFGLAHLAYMWIFWRSPAIRMRKRLPVWVFGYAVAYVVLMIMLVPHTGALTIPVMIYGLVLVGTAALSTLVSRVVAWGGFWFLVSDAILAFRIFTPEAMPQWTSGMVMLTYTLGQLLIASGVTWRVIATRRPAELAHEEVR